MKDVFAAVAVTLVVQTLAAMAMIAPSVLAPVAARDLGFAPQSIGIFVSITYFAAMFSGLVSGGLVARFGALALCQAAAVLAGVGLVIGQLGVAAAVPFAALVIGFGYGLVTPASSHILARRTPPRIMALIFSIKQTGVPMGGAIAGAVVPPLVLALGWMGTLPVLGAVCIATGVALFWMHRILLEPSSPDTLMPRSSVAGSRASHRLPLSRKWRAAIVQLGGPIKLVLAHAALRELASTSLWYAAVQLVFVTYFVSYLNLGLGYSLVAAGLVYAFAQAAGVVGRIVWGAIADRWLAPRKMLAVLGVLTAVAGGLSAAFSDAWPLAAIVAVAVLFGASAVGWNGVFLAEVARCAPAGQVGTATGGTQFFTFLGAVAGPPLFAAAVSITASYAWAFALCVIPALVIGVRLFRSRASEVQ